MSRHSLFLLGEFTRRDFKGRYAGSVMGFLWSFVQPLWMLALFTFVFSVVMRIPRGTLELTDSFAVFLFCGLLPWMAVQEGITRATTAITENAALVKKMSFPSGLLVWAVVLAALLHEAIALVLFMVVLGVTGQLSLSGIWILVIAVPLQVALTAGIGFFAAAINVFFRDTAQIANLLLQGWFYLTPIVYPIGLVPERYQFYLALNPLTPLANLYRQALLGGSMPPLATLTPLFITSVLALVVGTWVFRRLKPVFADEI
jgi:lipopolysaccharide transport system permease protein